MENFALIWNQGHELRQRRIRRLLTSTLGLALEAFTKTDPWVIGYWNRGEVWIFIRGYGRDGFNNKSVGKNESL